jgi:hypothetical protein
LHMRSPFLCADGRKINHASPILVVVKNWIPFHAASCNAKEGHKVFSHHSHPSRLAAAAVQNYCMSRGWCLTTSIKHEWNAQKIGLRVRDFEH